LWLVLPWQRQVLSRDVLLQPKSYGQVLFDSVCQRLNLLERDYFACSFIDANNVKVTAGCVYFEAVIFELYLLIG